MAVLYLDGFDYTDLSARYTSGARIHSADGGGRFGIGRAVAFEDVSIPYDTRASVAVGLAMNIVSAYYDNPSIFIRWGTSNVIRMRFYSENNRLLGVSYPGGTAYYLAPYPLWYGLWHHYVIQVNHSTTNGTLRVYLNGALIIDLSGVNTGQASDNLYPWTFAAFTRAWIDDLWITDGENLGDVRVMYLLPEADVQAGWSRYPSSLTANYLAVTQTNGDTDYVYTATSGAQDIYELGNLGTVYNRPVASVKAVAAHWVVRKDDAGNAQARSFLRIGTNNYYGSTINVAGTYTFIENIWDNNPSTGQPWMVTDVNGLRLGIERV